MPRALVAGLSALCLTASNIFAQERTAAAARDTTVSFAAYAGESGGATARISLRVDGTPGSRRFSLTSTAPQRDQDPTAREIDERGGGPYVVSGSGFFDALFALAVDDARQASVPSIRDGSYDENRPIVCACFETGAYWHYVWTRDLSYALDLGLAGFDPARARASLLFKTSRFRAGLALPTPLDDSTTQVIQDTGSGGSWPISTDRVVWALGADATLAVLPMADRPRFAGEMLAALRGTLDLDRSATFDPRDGLYGGEHSFLDWREQTYAPWIVDDLAAMAHSKGLSTNLLERHALIVAARLARTSGDAALAARYSAWATALGSAIDRVFWIPSAGLYATYTTDDVHAAPVAKYDLLGNALAITTGLATPARAQVILSRYPFAEFGPPVVWPQAPDQYVYHNRAIWPFVTAYALRAAAMSNQIAVADRSVASIVRGAALHLSNMENLEWLTGHSRYDDGPAINSRRQLWSIGAYYGMVVSTLFGWHPSSDGVRIAPYVTAATRALLGNADTVRLDRLTYAGKPVNLVLAFPHTGRVGAAYESRGFMLNGRARRGMLRASDLADDGNTIIVQLGVGRRGGTALTDAPAVVATSHSDPRAFMPLTPTASARRGTDGVDIARTDTGSNAPMDVWRDGLRVATAVSARVWKDRVKADEATRCYRVTVTGTAGLTSQPSAATCVRGSAAQTIAISDARVRGPAVLPADDTVAAPTRRVSIGDSLEVRGLRITSSGTYAVTFDYDNHVFALNTGITNAVKRVTMRGPNGARHEAIIQMPHTRPQGSRAPIRLSTPMTVALTPGDWTVTVSDYVNMSALAANARYTGPGGATGPINAARIATLRLDQLAP